MAKHVRKPTEQALKPSNKQRNCQHEQKLIQLTILFAGFSFHLEKEKKKWLSLPKLAT